MNTKSIKSVIYAFLILGLAACGTQPTPTSAPAATATLIPSPAATLMFTPVPLPTETPTPRPTDTPTLVPTATFTPTPTKTPVPTDTPTSAVTATPTLEPMVTITHSTYLRNGPGAVYAAAGSATAGQTLKVVGRDSSAIWLVVLLPGSSTRQGWVSLAVAKFNGDVASLPEVAAPPTPAPTVPPAPTPVPTQGSKHKYAWPPLPGTSRANVSLQYNTMLILVVHLTLDAPSGCLDFSNVNTEFVQITQPVTVNTQGHMTAGQWIERWTYQLCGTQVVYQITYTADGSGGINFDIKKVQ